MTIRLRISLFGVLLVAVGLSASSALAQTAADSSAIHQTALDYIDGYYTADAERMKQAVHPALRKRMVYTDAQTGADSLDLQSAEDLIASTGSRDPTPPSERRADVKVMDVYEDAAAVRIDAEGWIDYLHMIRWNGQWKIINVLWELRREPSAR